ncbi:MAG: HXXEE domain-containing protein [Hyphomicrobiaceae bacterium]|nr:HXXEE domain-containing protein [Hyphomicrobiaceae bacterium]MCC0024863.1 HXXEE domain-containing protein [Hyphomicrobiaceae bacterium]
MTKDPKHLILPGIIAIILPTLAFTFGGLIPGMVFVFAFVGGLIFYILTLWRTRIDATRILVPYLLTVILFIVHVYEEYLTHFEVTVTKMSGFEVSQFVLLTIAAFMAPIMWTAGAIFMLKRWRFGDFFLCTFFFAMLLAELTHYIFPFVIDGTFHYESGMYTAFLPLIPAAYGLRQMLLALNQARQAA